MSRTILRSEFDKMSETAKADYIRSGGTLIDALPQRRAVEPRRQRMTLSRKKFDALSPAEKNLIIHEGLVQLVDD